SCFDLFRVFLVKHPELGEVAAKVVDNEKFDQNEWNVAGVLNQEKIQMCPYIIQNILAKKFDQFTVILIEYANFGSLHDLTKAKKDLPMTVIRVIMRQLLQGLAYLHSKGIVHRDIKEGNILLHNPRGSDRIILKIADFGKVKVLTAAQQSAPMTFAG
ncbi:MAG: hypothetical protein EZS28_052936, partial [Streblomastix strix]